MWNIVIVDDQAIIADGLAKIIRNIGEEFHVAEKFSDSLLAWQYLKANCRHVDLLITDIRMPQLSGLDLIRKVHKISPGLLCAVLTGFSEFEYAKTAIDLGVVSYLVKPVEVQELRELLGRLVVTGKGQEETAAIAGACCSRETLAMKRMAETNYRDFDMNTVAEQLQLSKDYLFKLFKKETGRNLMDYLLDVRMEKAKELLQQQEAYKVYEISDLVGYTDYAYFTKLFKKVTGETPKHFQKYGKNERNPQN